MKGATAARPGSAATGEREGSGNLKVKMQITQPGDGNPGGGGGRKGEESGAVRGARMGGKKGLWPRGSEVGPGSPPQRCLLRVREAEKKRAPDPYHSARPKPIPRSSPGCGARGAAGCAWLRRRALETLLRWGDKRGGGGVRGAEAAEL